MMPWEYSQQTGELNHNGVLVYDKGYSGAGYAKNQPDIVVPLAIRKRIIASGDNILYVVR